MSDSNLSPAAQAVLDAVDQVPRVLNCTQDHPLFAAAALRAAADQAIPMRKSPWGSTLVPVLTAQESRERILAIAAELEGKQ